MQAIDALKSRVSVPPRLVGDPGPSDAEIDEMLRAAMTAPDHGMARPTRFVVARGDELVKLGEVFEKALVARAPDANEEARAKERNRPLRAPVVLTVLARIDPGHAKSPPVEQIITAGSAANNILIAAHAMGFGAIMLTGSNAYDPNVKAFFGLGDDDAIVSFIYLGSMSDRPPGKPRPDPAEYLETFGSGSA